MRRVALYLVGSVVVLALAGCGRGWLSFEQREPWRREAELSCIKNGTVKQSAAVTPIQAIEGPGMCGADHPFKVTMLGESSVLGYAGELRPPAAIPRAFPVPEPRETTPGRSPSYDSAVRSEPLSAPYSPASSDRASYDPPTTSYPQPASRGRPMLIRPPTTDPEEEDTADLDRSDTPYRAPRAGGPARTTYERPAQSYPQQPPYRATRNGDPDPRPSAPPPLGPSRAPAMSFAGGAAAVQPAATLACPMVAALDDWMASSVQPSAQRWFGQPVVEVKQISAYSCRGMNGQRGAPISEHAFGNALDIAAFTLADGRQVTVKDGWRGAPETQGFLRDVHASACQQFSTVLAPGSNAFHYDHIHVDLARRASGRTVCNPAAIPGDLIAQRARDHVITGSLGRSPGRLGFAAEDEAPRSFGKLLPRAIPGED
jgi:hypothetical protein